MSLCSEPPLLAGSCTRSNSSRVHPFRAQARAIAMPARLQVHVCSGRQALVLQSMHHSLRACALMLGKQLASGSQTDDVPKDRACIHMPIPSFTHPWFMASLTAVITSCLS
jgi:hypothetical protein